MVRRVAHATWHQTLKSSVLCCCFHLIGCPHKDVWGLLPAGDSESMISAHSQISLVSKTEFADNFQGLNSEEVEAAVHQVPSCLAMAASLVSARGSAGG